MTKQTRTRPLACPGCLQPEEKAESNEWSVSFPCGNLATYNPAGEWQFTEACGEAYRLVQVLRTHLRHTQYRLKQSAETVAQHRVSGRIEPYAPEDWDWQALDVLGLSGRVQYAVGRTRVVTPEAFWVNGQPTSFHDWAVAFCQHETVRENLRLCGRNVGPKTVIELWEAVKLYLANECPHCHGAGYVRPDVPPGHRDFGKMQSCSCTIPNRSISDTPAPELRWGQGADGLAVDRPADA